MSSSFQVSPARLRLHRAQTLLAEITSVRASLGQVPYETDELPLTGLMGEPLSQEAEPHQLDLDAALIHEFAPMSLGELRSPTALGRFDDQEELMEALREADEAHTGQTDELALQPSAGLDVALQEALQELDEELNEGLERASEESSLKVSQPTPIAYHPNQPAPMRALWGRRGFTPVPEEVKQQASQPSSPRLAFEESQELLALVSPSAASEEGVEVNEPERLSQVAPPQVEPPQVEPPQVRPPQVQSPPLFTAAYAPMSEEVELRPEPPPPSEGLEADVVQEGFGGASSSPDQPPQEVLEQAWSEVATPKQAQPKARGSSLWVALPLIVVCAALAYYYLVVLNVTF